ncbi:MAG: hypothetical protein KKE30_19045 [Gammaproteobacteria bacterium]|nr:hypothetical protein [Gammaproteobacteria bacterium]MBU1556308.1 hypothetical protein [Gammaproteobacteria bacterium]MBU2071712.1 hypothetical protein [Gammaproteobacteria bacterium]MBU2182383.1 hypothetical protein [Gammaproteobacteria bacterium]MBU2203562.1 hypothetical protein [Gammaproteobacteria bacterium]
MKKVFYLFASLILLSLPAKAALISLIPSDSDVFTGEYFDVAVQITDLQPGEVVTLFDISVVFDPAAIMLTGGIFGSGLGGVSDSSQDNTGNNFYEFSFLDDVSLTQLQSSPFTLFTLNFQALVPSSATVIGIEINPVGLLNYAQEDIAAEIAVATISIEQRAQTVSAPSSMPLLLLALSGLLGRRRTRSRR